MSNSNVPQIIFSTGIESLPTLFDCADCDCACSQSYQTPIQNQGAKVQNQLYRVNFKTLPLNQDKVICYNPLLPRPAVLNQAALRLLAPFAQPRYLPESQPLDSTLTQAIQLGLLSPTILHEKKESSVPTTLSAWLHLTDRCNLRCTYCYLPHHLVDMSLQTGQAALEATCRSAVAHHYRRIKLKYAGGEPLLRFPMISQLHRYAQTLATRHSLELEGVVLSNGTLLQPHMLEEWQALNLRLMISLDSLKDNQRLYADGRGTSGEAMRSIELALAHGFTPYISVTVTAENLADLPELMAWILARDLPFNLNFSREPGNVQSWTNPKSKIQSLKSTFRVIEANLPRRSLLASLIDRANLTTPHLRTCGAGCNYLVFDSQGRVSKCQMCQQQPITTAQAVDPLALLQADHTTVPNLSVEEKEDCRTCEWKHWCAGGCPLVTHQATGRYDVKSPYCDIYKTLYPEALRLEGLRLLKYAA